MTEYYNPGSAFNGRSSRFGRRAHPITGVLTGHAGDDWRALAETPIPAAADGKVILKRYNYNGRTGYGNYIVLEHFDNNTKQIVHTLYAHMIRESPLTVGAVISKRDTVGNVGSTGGSTGNHLHFEIRTGGTAGNALSGTPVDPDTYDISGLVAPDGASPTSVSNKTNDTNDFRFPVAPVEGKEYTAEELYGKLSQENTGYYLLSANRFWHGGVHFTSDNFSTEVPVQAIAEGTVIAYRINKKYPTTVMQTPLRECKYSTGFCLIKHSIPFKREKTAEEKQQEAKEKLAQTKAQLTGQQITIQNTARNYRDEEGINATKQGTYPIGTTLKIISVSETLKDNYYFAKVEQIATPVKAGETAKKETIIEGEHYIALLNKEGEPDKNKAGKAFFEMPKSTTTEATTAAPQSTTNNTETEANNTQTTTPTVSKPATTATEKTPLTMNLEFYSLYIHLCAYEDYQPAQEQEDQKDEDKPKRLKVTTNALLIRDKPRDEKDCTVIGKVLKGTIIEVLETKESSNGAFTDVKAKLISGEFKDRATGKKIDITTAWVPTRQNNQNFTEQTTEDASKASKEKTRPSYWQGKVTATPTNKAAGGDGLIIWKKYEAGKLIEKVGGLNAKSRFTFDSRQVVLTSDNKMIAECTAVGKLGFKGDGEDIDKFWTTVDSGSITREKVEPTLFNTVVPCNIKIKAGEALGYLGTYETPTATGEIANKKQVHVEIFTPNLATVQFLLNNPFKLTGRKYIKIPKNTLLKGELPVETAIKWDEVLKTKLPTFPGIPSEPEEKDYGFGDLFGLNKNASKATTSPLSNPTTVNTDIKTTQPTENKTTETTNDSTKQAEAAQETIPDYTTTQDHYFATDKLQSIKPTRVTNAGRDVKITSGEDEYYQIAVEKHTGYIKKQGLEEIDQHEWAKLGFQLVQEVNTNSDGYLDPNLMPAVFQQIYSKIDTNKDGKLQPEELKIALQNEEIRDQWSKLIAYHPSEWKTDTRPLLARFTQLLTNPLAPEEAQTKAQALLVHETTRMNTLTFLEQIVPPIPPMLYHFHPVTFVEYMQAGHVITLEEARVRAFMRMIRVGEGTVGPGGYDRLVGGKSFIKDYGKDYSDHPRILIRVRAGLNSTAAGAYQVMGYNWDSQACINWRKKYHINDFSPQSQDRFILVLITEKRKALNEVMSGKFVEAVRKCNTEWASLPESPYGQRTISWTEAQKEYDKYLEEELAGKSDLAIKIGDIDDFLRR